MKIVPALMIVTGLVAATPASAWWGSRGNDDDYGNYYDNRWNSRNDENFMSEFMNDMVGDMNMDMEMKLRMKARGNGRGNGDNYYDNRGGWDSYNYGNNYHYRQEAYPGYYPATIPYPYQQNYRGMPYQAPYPQPATR